MCASGRSSPRPRSSARQLLPLPAPAAHTIIIGTVVLGRARAQLLALGEAGLLGEGVQGEFHIIIVVSSFNAARISGCVAKGVRNRTGDLAIRCAGNAQRQREREQDPGHLSRRVQMLSECIQVTH